MAWSILRWSQPHWRWGGLPLPLRELLKEVYAAWQAGALQLAGIGTRTLLDRLMDDTVGNHGTFASRVDEMVVAGHLSVKQKEAILATVEFGNAAAHRGYKPYESHLSEALDVVEFLLHAHYVQPKVAERLKKTVPPRPAKTTPAP